jgi:carbamate kinase
MHLADMVEAGWDLAIGHGNGPQVGFILRRSEIAAKAEGMHEVPLDVCGADSQGAIGYELQQALHNEFISVRSTKILYHCDPGTCGSKRSGLSKANQAHRLIHG